MHLRYYYKDVIKNGVQQIIVMILTIARIGYACKGIYMEVTYRQSVYKYSIILNTNLTLYILHNGICRDLEVPC